MELSTFGVKGFDHGSKFKTSVAESVDGASSPAEDLRHSIANLKEMLEDHENDLNFPDALLMRMQNVLLRAEEIEEGKETSGLIQEEIQAEIEAIKASVWGDSPYEPVRAVCPPTDDPTLPTLTFRVWVIGILFVILFDGINTFFTFRMPGIHIGNEIAQLLAYPIGLFFAKILPTRQIGFGRWKFTLNPGHFNQKEHMLISIFVTNGLNGTYFMDIIPTQTLHMFYSDSRGKNFVYQFLGAMSVGMLGYGAAGLSRRFIVYPMQQIWPSLLSTVALNKALHHDDFLRDVSVKGPFGTWWRMGRAKFFYIFASISFFWFWLPDVLFQAVGTLNWMTWIAPQNLKLALITGHTGLGLNPLPTLDYSSAVATSSPLIAPLFATVNWFAGCLIWGLLAIAPLYFTNTFKSAHLPMLTNKAFDKFGKRYNISMVVDPGTLNFNETRYEAYSPMYLGIGEVLRDMSFLMSNGALIAYTGLYFHREIFAGLKAAINFKSGRGKDIHNRLMEAYPEVPEWWYGIVLVLSVISGCIVVEVYHIGMPIWGIFFAAVLAVGLVIPNGIILGATNVEVWFNVLGEYIAGYAIPGKPIANMMFKAFCVMAPSQALGFSSGLKLGHYSKIPPRDMFWVQIVGTTAGTLVSLGVVNWLISNVADLCTDHQKSRLTCPGIHTFFTGSLTWGLLGPHKMYGSSGIYSKMQWLFLVGFLMPFPVYFLHRRFPSNKIIKYIHVPVIIGGFTTWVPYGMAYMLPGLYLALIFNWHFLKKYEAWWMRYNYLFSAAMSVGIAVSAVVIFFALQYHDVTASFDWWGNTVPYAGLDYNDARLLPIPEGGL